MFHRRVLLSSTVLMAAAVGYGRRAYAACVNTGGSTYQCSGAETATQTINANNAAVSTVPGFSVTAPTGSAITITGDGALSYTDTNASPLIAQNSGGTTQYLHALNVNAYGDAAGTPGSIVINTNGAVEGGSALHSYGISAWNRGTGAITITANGDATGSTSGIWGSSGISAVNFGTDLTVTTGVHTTVSGYSGISVQNAGSGALTVTANGDVTATSGAGIRVENRGNGLSVTTAAGTTVSGGGDGIYARNYGSRAGAVTITANGDVTGTSEVGILARNYGTSLSVTTAAGTTVRGYFDGVYAANAGSGALTITANGDVTGTTGILGRNTAGQNAGIVAQNVGTDLTVTTGVGTTVSGPSGIFARNNRTSTGALTITVKGKVIGTAGDGIYARSTGGPIGITVAAAGTVTSTGATADDFAIETKSGAATIAVAGTVNGGAGGAIRFDQTTAFANRLELVTGAVVNGAILGGPGTDTLALSGTGSGRFDVGQISSFEAGEKTGSGSWTLTGNNTEFNTFSTSGGTLVVNGSLSNAAFTVTGGTLGGTGTVGSTTIAGNSTFAPGSGTPGTSMTVSGNLAFQSGAIYAIQVNPASSSSANVTGTATLGGATVNASFANGSYISKKYTILTATGGVSGTFGSLVDTNLPSNFHTALSYDANDVYLNLVWNFAIPGGINRNQQAVGNALTGYFDSNGIIPLIYSALTPAGLTQASGELGTGSQQATFNAMSQFTGLLTDPFMQRGGNAGSAPGTLGFAEEDEASTSAARKRDAAFAMFAKAPPRAFEPRWSVWAAGFGGTQSTDGNAAVGSNDTTSRILGTAVGADYLFSPNTLAGFALAGGGTSFSVNGLGSGRSDLSQAGAYVRHTEGPAYIAAALAYGWQDITTDRTVTVAGADRLRAEFNANAYSGRAEAGYRFVARATGDLGVTPYAAAQATTFDLPAYAEQVLSGSSAFALSYASKSVTDPRSELGLRTDKSYALDNGVVTLRSRLAWAHDFSPDRSIAATFQALPGASFVVNGAAQARDSLLTTASVETRWRNGWSAAATFEGEFSDVTRAYAGKAVLRYAW